MKSPLSILLVSIILLLTNCINNVEDVSTGETIDPDEISYSEDIQPIFNQSCGGSGCHINASTNGVNLSSYSAVMNSVGTDYGTEIVVPGSPDESPLVDKIEPNPDIPPRMPLTGGLLSATEINKIRAWIESGAEDN